MSTDAFPYAVWASNTLQNDIPANDNSLRTEMLITAALDIESTQPGSPTDGDCYIIGAAPSGAQWSAFTEDDIAVYRSGTWYAIAPPQGLLKYNENDSNVYLFDAGWAIFSGGGGGSTQGKQSIPIVAASIRPSLTAGCQTLTPLNLGSGQPDISTLDFDASTIEYAQFSIPMPKKWNAGTITARFRWSHAATSTNFGVVWGIQAVAFGDDDAMATSFGTAQTVTDTGGTTNDLYVSAETSAMTIAGTPAKEDSVYFRVYRDATNGSDTLAIDARLHSVEIFVTTDADTDA